MLVGEATVSTVCTTGFYVKFPEPNDPGQRLSGFLTAAQCARGDAHAPVAVMKAEDGGLAPTLTPVGEMVYLTPGDATPAVTGEPWTIAISPLAVFSSGSRDWVLPVDATIDEKPSTAATVQTADAVQRGRVPATWAGLNGIRVSGHVLDPAVTPELRDIPVNVDRVVVACDDTTRPVAKEVLGAPVTTESGGSTQNLGIITGIDEMRQWVVVDLISPFLARQNAELVVDR